MRTWLYWLTLAVVFTLPWEGAVDVPGVGQISKLAGVLAGGVWLLVVLRTRRIREPHAVHLWGLLYVVWCGLSMIWTLDGPDTQTRVLTYAQLLVLMLVVWESVWTLSQVRQVLMAYLGGCYVTVVALVGGYLAQGQAAEFHGRVTVGSFYPNDVGIILALGVPIAGYLLEAPGDGMFRRFWIWASVGYLPVAAFAVLVTGSRAGLAAMLPGALYGGYLFARKRPGLAIGGAVAFAGMSLAALPLVPPKVIERLAGTGADLQGGTLNERTDIWSEAIRIFVGHPVIGIGSGAFRDADTAVNQVGHNIVLTLLAEVGIIGFGLYLGMVLACLRSLRGQPDLLRWMWLAMFTSWLFAALLHNWEYRKQTWWMLVMIVICGALEDRPHPEHVDPERQAIRWEAP
ncbi:MAG TPA: O-antigen ligase family protein [Marmoricola sp.]|nr:O-antigen ligase family protein [Marmoricola sp.]